MKDSFLWDDLKSRNEEYESEWANQTPRNRQVDGTCQKKRKETEIHRVSRVTVDAARNKSRSNGMCLPGRRRETLLGQVRCQLLPKHRRVRAEGLYRDRGGGPRYHPHHRRSGKRFGRSRTRETGTHKLQQPFRGSMFSSFAALVARRKSIMILITGATGTNGIKVARLLSGSGQTFRAMVRSREGARALTGLVQVSRTP